MYLSTVTAKVMYIEAQNDTADMGYRKYTQSSDRTVEAENISWTTASVAFVCTGTLVIMYL